MADYWQKTIDVYGGLIAKPKLTEKLLVKPPFRFLHDLIMAVMGATGFPQNLYTEAECDSANVTDKEAKVAFLDKIIRHVEATMGEETGCKPSKVVAGLEPEATNVFLQGLARAATGQFQRREEPPREERKKKPAEEGKRPRAEDRKVEEAKKPPEEAKRPAEEQKAREEAEAKKRKEEKRLADEKKRKDEEEKRAAEKRALEEAQAREEAKAKEEAKKKAAAKGGQKAREEEKRRPPPPAEDEPVRVPKKGGVERPTTAGRRPPKVDDKVVVEDQKRPADAKPTNIIAEGKGRPEEEDDEIVKPTAKRQAGGVRAGEVNAGEHGKLVREIMSQEQLREQTREDGPDESGLSAPGGKKITIVRKGTTKTEAAKPKQVQITVEDMDSLKTSIQTLCQSTNPLGKSMDFITDDIDSMAREYEKWKTVQKQASVQVEEQRKLTEDSLQQLYDRLAEIEEQIREKQTKINHKKASILKNEMTIKTLLQGVVATK